MIHRNTWPLLAAGLIASIASASLAAETRQGTVVTEHLNSSVLQENRIGLEPNRNIKIYLPAGYAESGKAYPVVYYLHNMHWGPEQVFRDNDAVTLLDQAFANGVVRDFIFVAADYNTPAGVNIYENSPVSGRWLDFTAKELVPFIDSRFRTRPHRDSRALTGDFFGGRGALRLAMGYPEVFSVVYAMHPVATGEGFLPWSRVPIDWNKIHQAESFADLEGDDRAQIFVAVGQAFLPNLDRPPFYCDFYMEPVDGELRLHVENTRKSQAGFLLNHALDERATNLRTLRGIAFDWGRHDPTPAHVYAAEAFSRKLDDLGIEHEAEAFRGGPWDKNWTENGRFYTRVLPFLDRYLAFGD